MIQSYVLLGTLGVHSIEDIREKRITVMFTLFSGIIGVLLHLLFQNRSIYEMLFGVLPGIAILGIGYLTNGKIGSGDGIIFMVTGLYLGIWENLRLLFLSFFLAGLWGIFILAVKCGRKDDRIPLVPFLFFGYSLMIFG